MKIQTHILWKRIAAVPLTGNPVVDTGIIESMRGALLEACAEIECARYENEWIRLKDVRAFREKIDRLVKEKERLKRENQRLKDGCVLSTRAPDVVSVPHERGN
ncbi:hypothetical protein HF673_14665 [Acidithiobacillus thiooxidans]|uniref:Uncharacterized protein n=2 Tax=Acidithiobacillus thiooxidans TaxID=930 RepID=A0A5P9XRL3_ACITH|nr:hypothetical protein [Acidithiobacillus thiooxidans]MBU2836971.1 hypothetical protein [Acidithiobacillus thiooxidans]QFX96717.1 hypothetical protein GCD22_02531 [Acidithiobacillus thiooxidans ATCC 19377]